MSAFRRLIDVIFLLFISFLILSSFLAGGFIAGMVASGILLWSFLITALIEAAINYIRFGKFDLTETKQEE